MSPSTQPDHDVPRDVDIKQANNRQTRTLIGVMFAQAAFIVAVLQYLQ